MRPIACLFLAAVSLPFAAEAQRPRYGGRIAAETRAAAVPPLGCDTLVVLDAKGQPQPALAIAWSHDVPLKRWQFQLRPGVKLAGGAVLAPEAVAAALAAYQAAATPDGIVIQNSQPMPGLLQELSQPSACIDGTGPFMKLTDRPEFVAHEAHWAGRPYLDRIEFILNRSWKDQLADFESGKADMVELPVSEIRRQSQRGRRVWTSAALDLVALSFAHTRSAVAEERVRTGLALAIDRGPILNVLLQRQGEASASILPQWLSGFAFLYSAERDLARSRQLLSPAPAAISLGYDPNGDPVLHAIADRLALNVREAGALVRVVPGTAADVVLVRVSAETADPFLALGQYAQALGLPQPATNRTWESLQQAEGAMLAESWIVPLFHIPRFFGVSARMRNLPPANSPAAWRFDEIWVETAP